MLTENELRRYPLRQVLSPAAIGVAPTNLAERLDRMSRPASYLVVREAAGGASDSGGSKPCDTSRLSSSCCWFWSTADASPSAWAPPPAQHQSRVWRLAVYSRHSV